VHNHGRTDAGAEPAAGGGHQVGEDVLRQQAAAGQVALGAEDLTDAELVVADAAVERDGNCRVVGREVVVATETKHGQAPVQRAVVVDALHFRGSVGQGIDIEVAVDIAVQQSHEAGPVVGRLAGQGRRRAQQEDIVRLREAGGVVAAEDREAVDAVVGQAGVEHADHIVARVAAAAERMDLVAVFTGLAVQAQRMAGGADF